MNNSDIQSIQSVALELAKFFVDFCNNNGLLCYFCGGGCIGAVRHKGFIPWDDDLDFFMPRNDYEKLKKIWNDTPEYALRYPCREYIDHNIFITLRDKRTTMIKPYQKDLDLVHGITIDIFPLDGCPKGSRRKIQLFWALVYQLYCAQLVPTNHGRTIQTIGRILLGLVPGKHLRYLIWSFAEKRMTRYSISECDFLTELCAGPKYIRNVYPKEYFLKSITMPFEKYLMPIPIGYDGYLKTVFGDYMKLPPEEQQVPPHDAFIDTDKPYTEYKGIEYCQGKKIFNT